MVNILGVELGRPLLTVSTAVPSSDVFAMVASEAGIPEEELLLFNTQGVLIDPKLDLAAQTLEDSDLFAIRNNSVACDIKSVQTSKDWKTFKHFPELDVYEEPYPFTEELVESGVQETERLLFALTLKARRAYALYLMHMRRFDKVARVLDIRAKACPVLLKSVKLYYKQVQYHCSAVCQHLEKLKGETLEKAECFKPRLQALGEVEHLAPYVQQLLSNPAFKNYGKSYASSLRNLKSKLIEVERLLELTKKSIRDKMTRAKNRLNTLTRFLQAYFGSEVRGKEPTLAAHAVAVCSQYRQLRLQLNDLLRSGYNVIGPITINTPSDAEVEVFQDQIDEMERILAELDDFGRQEKEETMRIMVIFKETVGECADKANRLKLRGKDKLEKIEKKVKRLEAGKELLDFPGHFPANCEAALCELERRRATALYFTDMYAELCQQICTEEGNKRTFLDTWGEKIPGTLFAELEVAPFSEDCLKKLLDIPQTDTSEASSLFGALDPRCKHTILHFEGELRQAEVQQVQEMQGLQRKCERLEQDLAEVTALIKQRSEEKLGLRRELQNYAGQLEQAREDARGSQLRVLRTELDRLQKKEAAFKEGWVEQVQSLEMEMRLLRAKERKRNRPHLSELPSL